MPATALWKHFRVWKSLEWSPIPIALKKQKIKTDGIRIPHRQDSPLVGNPEVGNPDIYPLFWLLTISFAWTSIEILKDGRFLQNKFTKNPSFGKSLHMFDNCGSWTSFQIRTSGKSRYSASPMSSSRGIFRGAALLYIIAIISLSGWLEFNFIINSIGINFSLSHKSD